MFVGIICDDCFSCSPSHRCVQVCTSPEAHRVRRDFAAALYAKYLRPSQCAVSPAAASARPKSPRPSDAPVVVSPSILSDIESQFAKKDAPLHPLLFEGAQAEVSSSVSCFLTRSSTLNPRLTLSFLLSFFLSFFLTIRRTTGVAGHHQGHIVFVLPEEALPLNPHVRHGSRSLEEHTAPTHAQRRGSGTFIYLFIL